MAENKLISKLSKKYLVGDWIKSRFDKARTVTDMDGTLPHCSALIFENLKAVEKSKNHLNIFKSCIDLQNFEDVQMM